MMKRVIMQEGISSQGVSSTIYKLNSGRVSLVDRTSFLAESLYKEVMGEKQLSGRSHNLKKLKSLHKGFMSILVTAMVVSPATTFAQTGSQMNSIYPNATVSTESQSEITPDLVMQWGMTLSIITVAIGVAIASSLLAIAGVYRMLRKRKEAEEWTVDIIKGLVQVLIAIPLVYSLFYLAQLIFRNLPILGEMF